MLCAEGQEGGEEAADIEDALSVDCGASSADGGIAAAGNASQARVLWHGIVGAGSQAAVMVSRHV